MCSNEWFTRVPSLLVLFKSLNLLSWFSFSCHKLSFLWGVLSFSPSVNQTSLLFNYEKRGQFYSNLKFLILLAPLWLCFWSRAQKGSSICLSVLSSSEETESVSIWEILSFRNAAFSPGFLLAASILFVLFSSRMSADVFSGLAMYIDKCSGGQASFSK